MINLVFIIEAAVLFAFVILFLVKGLSMQSRLARPFIGFALIFLFKIILIGQDLIYSGWDSVVSFALILNFIWLVALAKSEGKR
jgi:hypothetical protein